MPFKDGKQGLAGPFQLSSWLSKSVQEQNWEPIFGKIKEIVEI